MWSVMPLEEVALGFARLHCQAKRQWRCTSFFCFKVIFKLCAGQITPLNSMARNPFLQNHPTPHRQALEGRFIYVNMLEHLMKQLCTVTLCARCTVTLTGFQVYSNAPRAQRHPPPPG